jgi:hypothetical protein
MRFINVDKLVKNVFLIALLVALSACSVSRKMERRYTGSTRDVLLKEMGEPNRIVKLEAGKELFIYEKEKFIRETEIGTGKPTLDPRMSPAFTRVETYRFTIDSKGVILSTDYEKSYR